MKINTTELDAMAGAVSYTPRTNREEVMHFISSYATLIILVVLTITIYFIYKKYSARLIAYLINMTKKQKRVLIVMQLIAGMVVIVMDYQLGSGFDIFGDMLMVDTVSWTHFAEQPFGWDALNHFHFKLYRVNGEETLIAWAITLFPTISIYIYNFIQKD